MLGKLDRELAFVQNALDLRARRQELLAANIANADTPNYKARDIDFQSALRSAMGAAGGPLALSRTSAGHIDKSADSVGGLAEAKYRTVLQPSLDGNTVDTDIERGHFAENAIHYQFLLERARGTFRTISSALESR